MTRPTRRRRQSLAETQQQYINRLVSKSSYRDVAKDESINLLTSTQIEARVRDQFGVVKTGLALQFERGEVVSDPYGRGSLQKLNPDEE